MRLTYEQMKEQARQSGKRVTDFIALAAQNDPFYAGRPNNRRQAQWFAELWRGLGYEQRTHLRRVHYQLVSQASAIVNSRCFFLSRKETEVGKRQARQLMRKTGLSTAVLALTG
ncbi:hypothetical protein [Ktedonobacter racemifer]|uniref:Uncharacterized protein n=1 Tax=Ktedonobacter racemifer DSM 44963 TaxID=485913 RepID=D6U1Y1_KTERA|nr:hypothetical protein [Ktedonobacter racemifer]EFH80865.1 hypothetical protein Krac_1497 [Ktedonobacter racemifer DSM 44963]